ncbi:phage tail protein [Diaphorobacter sp. JS3050]|jgi:P2-related tail formation protein|uniref:phage tail protein n=1 Tax=Diaphorobacter sp. JS3050 TaxID=2735554 RepID=UPI001554BC75|nr:phage tail protein [Diaphorobacter sp. JS3050]QJY32139.1 phage tail protein [Diaphorobacter sp. JS3050]
MTADHLLPANATPLEQALSLSTDALSRLALPADAIRQFKTDPTDPLLPWLIWEYGLGELLPYLPEPRQAIAEGILWQRLRGTPAALATALSWIGMGATVEQEPPGVHFAEFQLDPGQVLDSDTAIANLIAIARLSAPARSRLSRIYHGHDLRRVVLDESRLGEALLSDHSGVFWRDGQTKLSFGRVRQWVKPPTDIVLSPTREATRFAVARLIDRYLLDFSALGDPGHTRNEEILHSHLFTLANALGLPDAQSLLPERRFARAMVVLSDSTPLGDINANLPRFAWREEGQSITLGGRDQLSATPHRLIRVEVLERSLRDHPADLVVPTLSLQAHRDHLAVHRVQARADQALGMWALGESVPSLDRGFVRRDHTRGNPALPDAAGWRPRLYQRAQVVLSEVVLGEVNTRTPRRALLRIRSLPTLGDFTLGDLAEVERRTLTEMRLAVSGFTDIVPYEFAGSAASLQRLLTRSAERNTHTQAALSRVALASGRATWSGQSWTGVRWPASSWTDTRELIGATHQTLN